ncbi:hypothetical protein CEB3_c28130 [Peptococcaceae bacterium CEB3]|nr:hypothetical protein CEB3_c28130 [Peptococcaceae bacterium CEB3]
MIVEAFGRRDVESRSVRRRGKFNEYLTWLLNRANNLFV